MDISSIIVSPHPESVEKVKAWLSTVPGVETHATATDGRIIATIEADTDEEAVRTYESIGRQDGVLSVSLVYHQYEPDPNEEV
ncbi:MAG: chaperone NapD [Betaproteobacteria bacterium]|nr:chaperone NapD [Betaproteobacteria bacterium]